MGWLRQKKNHDTQKERRNFNWLKYVLCFAFGVATHWLLVRYDAYGIVRGYYPKQYNLVVGAFLERVDAEKMRNYIATHGINAVITKVSHDTYDIHVVSVQCTGTKDVNNIKKKLHQLAVVITEIQ